MRRLDQRPWFWLVVAGCSLIIGLSYLSFAWSLRADSKPRALAYVLFAIGHTALSVLSVRKSRLLRRAADGRTS